MSEEEKLEVLFLPKWYPNKIDPFDGNFVENHARAIKDKCSLKVLFAHSHIANKEEIIHTNKEGIETIEFYFKKANFPIASVEKIINGYRYFKAQRTAYSILYKNGKQPDLTHIHVLSRSSAFALWLNKRKNIPYYITEHWSGYLPNVGAYKGFLKKILSRLVTNYSAGISVVAKQLKNAMINHNLLGNYHIIPNVVDTSLFKPKDKTERDIIKILFVGNLLQSPKKIFDIIKAVKSLSEKRNDFILDIYGEGSDEKECISLIKELNANSFIKLNGVRERSEIASIIADSDFLFLFSEFENQPCVLAEAAACGVPVIAPNFDGIKEHLHPFMGKIVEAGNKKQFVETLDYMCDNFKNYNSDKIREYAVNTFSEEVISSLFFKMYNK